MEEKSKESKGCDFEEKEQSKSLRVVIYCRVGRACDENELDEQAQIVKAFCKNNNMDIVAAWLEEASGNNLFRKPILEIKQLMIDGKIDAIVVKNASVLSRDFSQLNQLIMQAEAAKTDIYAVSSGKKLEYVNSDLRKTIRKTVRNNCDRSR